VASATSGAQSRLFGFGTHAGAGGPRRRPSPHDDDVVDASATEVDPRRTELP